MTRYCLTLNLKNVPKLIAEYETWHTKVWPEVINSITGSGIEHMEIYRMNERLFMIIEANDSFSFEKKSREDTADQKVQEWEALMWKYQEALPGAAPGEKWMLMKKIFHL